MQLQTHTKERTAEGTAYVRANAEKISGNCRKLLAFWQEKRWWLNKHDCLKFVGVDCLAQRVADLIHKNGIQVEKLNEPGDDCTRYRLKCTCHHVGGIKQTAGCYAHDSNLKVSNL